MVKRPDHVPASFAPVNALGCECTFWLGKDPAALPALAWAPCGDNVLPGLGCEKVAVSGFGQDWFHFAAIASDTDHAGAPLAALAVFRDFVGPKTIVNWFWLDMTNLTAVAELVSDRAAGTCIAQIPRLAPGVLLLNVNQSKEVPREEGGASFAGNSGFATLRLGADGAAVYAASEPFGGTSNYTPTSTDVYGRLLDNTSAGIYRANGLTPKGELLDLAPFTSAFPESSLGGSLVVLVSDGNYSGTGLYAPTTGFRPLLPPSLAEERAAFDLGGDGSVLVWTAARGRDGNGFYANNELYTAPATASVEQLANTKRRVAKADGGYRNRPWAVGCGYAAQRWETSVLVVRLSDGTRWRIAKTSITPRAITCEHIYGELDTLELGRIRLDQLGDPLPSE